MGTNRLGTLPRTRTWRRVVEAFEAGAGAAQVARESLEAAARRLARAADDAVLADAVRLMMLLPIAANSDDFAGALRGVGVDVPDGPDFCDVLAAVSERLDGVTPAGRGRTDVGEMAQAALTETLAVSVGGTLKGLFDAGPEEVRRAFASQGTVANFGALAAGFFARFTQKVLHYFLSRELPEHVGPGGRFAGVADLEAFNRDLDVQCRETAAVVERFSGEWFSRERHQRGGEIDPGRAAEFAHGAFAKLTQAMKPGAC